MNDGLNTQAAARMHYAAAIGALVGIFFFALGVIFPIIVLLVSDTDAFARKHAWQAIKFQLLMLLYVLLAFALLGIAMLAFAITPAFGFGWVSAVVMLSSGLISLLLILAFVPLYIFAFVMPLIMANRASDGECSVYPFTFSKPWQV